MDTGSEGAGQAPASSRGAAVTFWRRLLLSEHLLLWVTLAYFLLALAFEPRMASSYNLQNLFLACLPLLIVATGQTYAIITAGIDLSATGIIALTSITGALVMTQDGGPLAGSALATPAGIVTMLGMGVLLGTLNGFAVSRLGMPPFMVTLSTGMFFGGLALLSTRSVKVAGLPEAFLAMTGAGWGIAWEVLVATLLVAAAHLVLRRTVAGRWVHAVGYNVRAARVAGVPVARTIVLAYAVSGASAAAASAIYTSRLETGDPTMGRALLLDIIGAVVIGGTSLFGGRGKVTWTVLGVLFITVVRNSLNMLNYSEGAIRAFQGALILLAALADVWRRRFIEGSSGGVRG